MPQAQSVVLKIKAAVRARDGFCCTGCGLSNEENIRRTGRQLQVHRVTPGSLYSVEPGVCVTLCTACHGPKPRRSAGQPDLASDRAGVPLHVWIDSEIAAALQGYLDETEPSVFKTAAVESALKDFLRSRGHWPPKRRANDDG